MPSIKLPFLRSDIGNFSVSVFLIFPTTDGVCPSSSVSSIYKLNTTYSSPEPYIYTHGSESSGKNPIYLSAFTKCVPQLRGPWRRTYILVELYYHLLTCGRVHGYPSSCGTAHGAQTTLFLSPEDVTKHHVVWCVFIEDRMGQSVDVAVVQHSSPISTSANLLLVAGIL